MQGFMERNHDATRHYAMRRNDLNNRAAFLAPANNNSERCKDCRLESLQDNDLRHRGVKREQSDVQSGAAQSA